MGVPVGQWVESSCLQYTDSMRKEPEQNQIQNTGWQQGLFELCHKGECVRPTRRLL